MSLFGGGGSKTTTVYVPQPAPRIPTRNDPASTRDLPAEYRTSAAARASYTRSIIGGGAPAPRKSYASKIYGGI